MVHKNSDKRNKGKPRGRPFTKGNKYRFTKSNGEVLADTRHESIDERGTINEETIPIPHQEEEKIIAAIDLLQEGQKIIDSISFTFEKNVLTILLKSITKPSKAKHFKIKLMLNDKIEIKPSTFVTKQSALSFWNLLKGELQ